MSLCLDNDAAGAAGMEAIREAIQADGELSRRIKSIVDNPPSEFGGKDYNALLQQKTKAMREALHRGETRGGQYRGTAL